MCNQTVYLMKKPLNTTFFNQFECRRKLTLYSEGRITLEKAIEDLNSALAGYLIGNRDNHAKYQNLIDCRDWLQTIKPDVSDVKDWLTLTHPLPEPLYFTVDGGHETTVQEFIEANAGQIPAEHITEIMALVVGERRKLGNGAHGDYYVRRTR